MHELYHNARIISQCTNYVTMHGLYHNARIVSQCTSYITMHELYHNARIISQCTNYITMHELYHSARIISQCTNYITMHELYHNAQIISLCTNYITMHELYHNARIREGQVFFFISGHHSTCMEKFALKWINGGHHSEVYLKQTAVVYVSRDSACPKRHVVSATAAFCCKMHLQANWTERAERLQPPLF